MFMEINKSDVRQIYAQLQDDTSRFLFEKRLMYSLTEDASYIREIAMAFPEMEPVKAIAAERMDNFIFGAGTYGDIVAHLAPGHFLGILDNNRTKWGGKLGGVTIVPPETIQSHPDSRVFVAVRVRGKHYQDEIVAQLLKMGIDEKRIVRVDQAADRFFAQRTQYFDLPALPHVEDETFVDTGCWDGGTSLDFAGWAGRYRHIYAFEPDPDRQEACQSVLGQMKGNTTLLPYGAWDKRTELHFSDYEEKANCIDANGTICVSVSSIDQELVGERVTFIKMDIEGSEMQALRGAEQTIRAQRPKLAISLYHRFEDVIEIPQLILSFHPDYQLYLRHYTFWDSETVLYAI